jgi:MFS family permease
MEQPQTTRTSISSQKTGKDATPEVTVANEYADAEKNYDPKSLKFWLIILSVYLSFFLVALDRMIVATAIPAITNTFGSIEDIGWYGSGYMLTCAIFNPLFGKIYQLYDTKWMFLASIVVFEVGSAVCGAAPSSAARKQPPSSLT